LEYSWRRFSGGSFFFGIHGIQIIPLDAFYFSKKLNNNTFTNITNVIFAFVYLEWITFAFHQTKQGLPFSTL